MEAYSAFAEVYDLFMDNIPYGEWSEYILSLLREYGVSDGLLLDLGCGTGSLTELLSAAGYDMIGVDNSPDMLLKAQEKRQASGRDILYLCQDMRDFELYGTVRAVVSVCDCMNYLLEEEDLFQVFSLVNNYLDPGGVFIFDLNTEYKYRELIGDCTIAESREEGSFIWENAYDEESRVNEYDLTLFVPEGDLYRRYTEAHLQRAWRQEEILAAAKRAGMIFTARYEAFTREEPGAETERVYYIFRECGKEKQDG